jgi:hypothetical protein
VIEAIIGTVHHHVVTAVPRRGGVFFRPRTCQTRQTLPMLRRAIALMLPELETLDDGMGGRCANEKRFHYRRTDRRNLDLGSLSCKRQYLWLPYP